jgi:hypothetical protein
MCFIIILDRDLILLAKPSPEVDEFAALGAEGKKRPLAGLGIGHRLFADGAEHGN